MPWRGSDLLVNPHGLARVLSSSTDNSVSRKKGPHIFVVSRLGAHHSRHPCLSKWLFSDLNNALVQVTVGGFGHLQDLVAKVWIVEKCDKDVKV